MASYVCAISGVDAEVPVVSPASGEIFEKRLIVKYVEENGTDPVNGKPLKENELVEIKRDESTRATLRPLPTASIPVLLKTLQDEWDACMLNSYTLRQELQAAREELSHALYQNDAACRVINRLSLELQSARSAMAKIPQHRLQEQAQQPSRGANGESRDVEMDVPEELPGLNDEAIAKIQEKGSELSTERKQRGKTLPEGLASAETLAAYREVNVNSGIHSTGTPGITCMDLQKRLVLTGGVDKTLALFNLDSEEIEATFKGHRKQITSCILHPNLDTVISASADSTVRIWSKVEDAARHVVAVHSGVVSGVSLHPTGDYVLSFSDDTFWSLIDLQQGRPLVKNRGDSNFSPLSCGECHPDGLIFATGTRDSMVKIWDLREELKVADFPGHQGEVRSISFSENGYHLATGAADGEVKIWDLRKLRAVKSFAIGDDNAPISAVRFDQSGAYVAAASNVVQVLQVKSWNVVNTFEGHSAPATAIRFGENANFIASTSMDRTLRIYSKP
ncbi:Pre-mRNA-processing factor 19 [Aphelenchoides fujianensis]|nr:Pre-mRNA-processing factor 19 [Aphelenchoides fujianensis]